MFYTTIPHFGSQSDKLTKELSILLSSFSSFYQFVNVQCNYFKNRKFFNNKNKLPFAIQSSVVYQICCTQCVCEYVGTTHMLHNRVGQHEGGTFRTGAPSRQPAHFNIRDHCAVCNVSFDINNILMLSYASINFDLKLQESLYIFMTGPKLNDVQSTATLLIANR